MRRWNGWGDENTHYPLKPAGLLYLQQLLQPSTALADCSYEQALARVPAGRLPAHSLINSDRAVRLRHARGQSLPDWLAMRSGEMGPYPDGVAEPRTSDEVRELLDWAQQHDVIVIPYGGGTSVAGHINPFQSDKPILTISLARMNQLITLDKDSQLATFGAGANGPAVEQQLREHGYTLGHFPQSWELSTLGGWVASRSSGQQSLRYGRIEQLFAGGRMETLRGSMHIPTFPASSAGPDLREWLLGSEGRLGIITEVKVRVSRIAPQEDFHVAFAPDWTRAVAAVKSLIQARVPLSMLRVSNAQETRTQLTLAGHEWVIGGLHRLLSLAGCGDEKCMITFGVTGSADQCQFALRQARRMLRQHDARYLGTLLGRKWEDSRFRSPYLRHGLWEHGYAVDTVETAVDWQHVTSAMASIEGAIRQQAGPGESVLVFSHLSHLYAQGSSIYTTYVFRCADSYDATLARWKAYKQAASDAIVASGGTISHQHGVGRDHAPWLHHEKGQQGMAAIAALAQHFDPDGQLNPGCLIDAQEEQ